MAVTDVDRTLRLMKARVSFPLGGFLKSLVLGWPILTVFGFTF